jgi:hypothetical protein
MGTSAAMVQLKVVKAGGAGSPARMKCSDILACFDPPIKFGTHAKMVGTKRGYQAEHVLPAAAMHKKGRKGARIAGASGYSTSGAMTFMAGDGQKRGYEHKILTDQMRKFSQANDAAIPPKNATMKEWLEEYKKGAKEALDVGKPKRKINRPDLDRASLIDKAAECIKRAAAESFSKMRPPVRPSTPMRNPWKATSAQKRAARAAARSRAQQAANVL